MNKMLVMFLILMVLATLAVFGAYSYGSSPRSEIEAGEAAFGASFAKGDIKAVSDLYSADAELLPPNAAPISGQNAIRTYWRGAFDAGVKRVDTTPIEVQDSRGLAFEKGTYILKGSDGTVMDEGKYLVIWKRYGSTWKMFRDIWNSSRPPAR